MLASLRLQGIFRVRVASLGRSEPFNFESQLFAASNQTLIQLDLKDVLTASDLATQRQTPEPAESPTT